MASDESMTPHSSSIFSSMQDIDVDLHDYPDNHDPLTPNYIYYDDDDDDDDKEEEEEAAAAAGDRNMSIWLSSLSLDTSDGDDDDDDAKTQPSHHQQQGEEEEKEVSDCDDGGSSCSGRRPGRRERRLDRAWETRRCHWAAGGDGPDSHSGGSSPCVVVRPRGPGAGAGACMCMDMEEVKACRDLGLELPSDWSVEIPPVAFSAGDGGDSPVGSWRVSGSGEDQRDMKARLRVWAQAVALSSLSRLSS